MVKGRFRPLEQFGERGTEPPSADTPGLGAPVRGVLRSVVPHDAVPAAD